MDRKSLIKSCFNHCRTGNINAVSEMIKQYPWLMWEAVEDGTGRAISHYANHQLLEIMEQISQYYCNTQAIPNEQADYYYNLIFCRRCVC